MSEPLDAESLTARLAALEARVALLESGRFDLLTLSSGLHIVGEDGRLLLTMLQIEGEPAIKMWSSDRRSGIFLGGDPGAPELNFTDAEERIRLKLMLGPESGPTLALVDEAGTLRLSASVTDGVPRVMLFDSAGTIRLALDVDEESAIELSDRADRPRIALRTKGLDEPLVCTIDSEGSLTARL
jgi:hypothetical protein